LAELAMYAPDAVNKNESIGHDAAAAAAASLTGHVGTALYVSPEMLKSDSRYNQVCCYFSLSTHTHTHLTALFPGLPGKAGTRKVKPIWILPKQETVSGSGISWAVCKSAPCSRQTTTPAPHHSVFYRPDALPATQPTASKH